MPSVTALGALHALGSANNYDDGQQPGPGLSLLQTLLIYVGIPALVFAVIWVLVAASSSSRGPRYRPGVGWWSAPVWFNGPAEPDAVVGALGRPAPDSSGNTVRGGGASARW